MCLFRFPDFQYWVSRLLHEGVGRQQFSRNCTFLLTLQHDLHHTEHRIQDLLHHNYYRHKGLPKMGNERIKISPNNNQSTVKQFNKKNSYKTIHLLSTAGFNHAENALYRYSL